MRTQSNIWTKNSNRDWKFKAIKAAITPNITSQFFLKKIKQQETKIKDFWNKRGSQCPQKTVTAGQSTSLWKAIPQCETQYHNWESRSKVSARLCSLGSGPLGQWLQFARLSPLWHADLLVQIYLLLQALPCDISRPHSFASPSTTSDNNPTASCMLCIQKGAPWLNGVLEEKAVLQVTRFSWLFFSTCRNWATSHQLRLQRQKVPVYLCSSG